MSKGWDNELASVRAQATAELPLETLAVYQHGIEDLSRSGIVERALKVGDAAPNFALTSAGGDRVQLADVIARGPAVISFFRGTWCPFCAFELGALQGAIGQIRDLGGRVLAISPQMVECDSGRIECSTLGFDILNDPHNSLAQKFGIVFHLQDEIQALYRDLELDLPEINGDDSFDLPVPATFVIDTSGIIRLAFVDPDYTRRLDPAEIVGTLQRLRAVA